MYARLRTRRAGSGPGAVIVTSVAATCPQGMQKAASLRQRSGGLLNC